MKNGRPASGGRFPGLFDRGGPSRIAVSLPAGTRPEPRGWGGPSIRMVAPVFSLLGVLGIVVVLFFVVAITGRLILGR